jgi:uncharacterized protein (TIGR02996 family)
MPSDDEFIRAIREFPEDMTARLAYADWLDEHGEAAKAEYLRLRYQFWLTTERLTELGEQLDPAWLSGIRGGLTDHQELITLRSGQLLLLSSLRQWPTTEDLPWLLIPEEDRSWMAVERIVAREREQTSREPYLIPPEPRPPKLPADVGIPRMACLGRFSSLRPARDPTALKSEMVILWFQDDMALPIDPVARQQILAIDWERHAADDHW